MKKTPWFDGSVKPARPGVYERNYSMGPRFCRWTGTHWMGASLDPESADRTESDSFFDDKPWRGVAEQEDRITVECPDRPPDVSLATIFRATGDLVAHLKGATFKQHAVRVTVDDQPSPFEFLVHGDGKLIVWNQSLAKEG